MRNTLPLAGINVVDFGQYIAGPAVAMILADLGANVVHIDPLGGPMWDDPANAVLNRNKLCIELDLKTSEGREKALCLCATADIIIENFRPGKLQGLGIDFELLRQADPRLITLSVPGFASNDTLRREWKATEAIISATSGVYADMGFNRLLMGCNPSFSPLALGSAYATTLASSAVSLALYAREKSGRGDHIEVPIASALMEGLSYNSIVIEDLPERYATMREHEIARRREHGLEMDVTYEELQEFLDPFFRTYECKDGRFFYVVCPSHRNHAKRCLQVAGLYDELVDEGLPDVEDLYLPIAEWDGETSIGVYPLPKKWADIIAEKMKRAFVTKTSEEWGQLFGEHGIPGAPHRSTQEWMGNPHNVESGLTVTVNDENYGEMKQPGPLIWFEGMGEELCDVSPRQYGDFNDAKYLFSFRSEPTLNIASLDQEQGQQDDINPLWLDGVRVLDLTNVIAGPHSTGFLARFGAKVTKLDPTKSLYDPLIGVLFSFLSNCGKESLLMDMLTDQGKTIFEQLVKESDVVVINAPERQVEALGLSDARLKAINPNVIFCRLDCFGGPKRGEKTDYIGYDDIIQANSGIMSRFGGAQTPEEHAHIGTLDVNCGFAGGLSIAVALYHRERTGQALRARTSLSSISNLAQIKYSHDYASRGPFNEPSGREALGYHSLSHIYPTSDGWLYLDASEKDLETFELLKHFRGVSVCNEADRKALIANALRKQTCDYWINTFCELDIGAAEIKSIEWLRDKYSRKSDGKVGSDLGSYAFSVYEDHPSGLETTTVDHYSIRPSHAGIIALKPTERFGTSSREVLSRLSLSDDAIQALINTGVVSEGWSDAFIPN
ncbi:CoA transferase [Enterovibrio sp. ZSDZ42]|uniref:CoA transferase n=1 Tax=Enterovibrio gelatinilyticus TaxID=2899819 RepID=A0ABT5R112_9GAMM|nr:CoA transferase [Enterovibrio sp. ZSDZ42]MDD1793953.1 CoA transferase [Enterovibrio sp. ZSDZ42]